MKRDVSALETLKTSQWRWTTDPATGSKGGSERCSRLDDRGCWSNVEESRNGMHTDTRSLSCPAQVGAAAPQHGRVDLQLLRAIVPRPLPLL